MKKPTLDYNTCSLDEIKAILEDWEFVHQETYGRITCDSLHCFTEYTNLKNIYNRRKFIEGVKNHPRMETQSLKTYQKEKLIFEDGNLKQYVLTSNKKIKEGVNITLKEDIEAVYFVEIVVLKDIKQNMLKIVFKGIKNK